MLSGLHGYNGWRKVGTDYGEKNKQALGCCFKRELRYKFDYKARRSELFVREDCQMNSNAKINALLKQH